MTKPLFRQEAIDAQREKFFGEVTEARPLPLWMFTLLAGLIAVLIVVLGVWGQYTRRERVEGFLASDVGAARVLFADAGRIAELMVKEGDVVTKGMPLVRVSFERATGQSQSTAQAVAGELGQRRELLAREQSQIRELGIQQVAQIRKRVADLQNEMAQLEREIRIQDQRLQSAREQAKRFEELGREKFVSDIVVRQKRDEVTDQELKLQTLRRSSATLERDLSQAKLDEPSAALRARSQADQLSRQISEVQQTLVEVDAKRESIIVAPIDGIATNIAVSVGQSVQIDAVFATILPKKSQLRAELLVPTRAIGFIQKGRDVVLRYEAFPFERFGQYRGVVADVGQTVWSTGEKVGPLTIREPVYRVTVALEAQTVNAQGQALQLKSGMLVNADILLEKRSLFEWLFEPVMQLRGRF
ncbi:MAG: HlyD family efflux transporter periplasmic adaptor subunit [Gammaproteobacteria bacterium]|nr:HlyD family efflux transporter periplasmic adaptor subunit [Gammaproteobacteria bacterium]